MALQHEFKLSTFPFSFIFMKAHLEHPEVTFYYACAKPVVAEKNVSRRRHAIILTA
jgi:hypothetical protein